MRHIHLFHFFCLIPSSSPLALSLPSKPNVQAPFECAANYRLRPEPTPNHGSDERALERAEH